MDVILVGLPGAGKTTVGRAVAEKLGRSFLDFDEEVERREVSEARLQRDDGTRWRDDGEWIG